MKGFLIGFVVGVSVAIAAAYYLFAEPPLPANAYGRFVGNLAPSWLDDGRTMKLKSDFMFVDPNNKAWIAPSGSVVDGASIPRNFWSIIGGPFEGKYRKASVVHDTACQEKKESSDDVHRMFYYACRCAGVDETKAKAMYLAVLHGGPQWNVVHETKMIDGVQMMTSKPVDQIEGKSLSVEESKAIVNYVTKHNPDFRKIKTLKIKDKKVIEAPSTPRRVLNNGLERARGAVNRREERE